MLFKIYFEPRFKYFAISKYSQISLSRSRWDCLNTFTLTYPLFSKYQCSRYLSSTVFYDPGTVLFLIEIYCFILLIRMKPFILFVKWQYFTVTIHVLHFDFSITFQAFTALEDIDTCIQILESNDWNLMVCNNFLKMFFSICLLMKIWSESSDYHYMVYATY